MSLAEADTATAAVTGLAAAPPMPGPSSSSFSQSADCAFDVSARTLRRR